MNLPRVGAAGLALSLLAIVVGVFIVIAELKRRRLRHVKSPPLLAPVCSMCLERDDTHPVWDNESQFCSRCHKVTTCYRVLVKGPALEARP